MSRKFTVVNATDSKNDTKWKCIKKMKKMSERWEQQYYDAIVRSCNDRSGNIQELTQDELARIGFAGVKFICASHDLEKEYEKLGIIVDKNTLLDSQIRFYTIDDIFAVLGCLTLRNFVNAFPITKRYDGYRFDCKDYFFTKDVLSKMDWDKPIGKDNIPDLLWDYLNEDLGDTYVKFLSDLYRMQIYKDIAEQWCDDNGIGTYTVNKGTGSVNDNQTGHTTKLKRRSTLQIVK